MKRIVNQLSLAILAWGVFAAGADAQSKPPVATEPQTPAARSFHDLRSGVSFRVPAGWDLTRRDREVSTFNLDARSTTKATQLRAVANITFNPYPQSTFSGAYFYASFAPHLPAAECTHQASTLNSHPIAAVNVDGVPFTHGYDEHGGICTESRDEIYTGEHNGSCYRFDLVINNFGGGEVSGVRDISAKELESVRHRLEAILATVEFDKR